MKKILLTVFGCFLLLPCMNSCINSIDSGERLSEKERQEIITEVRESLRNVSDSLTIVSDSLAKKPVIVRNSDLSYRSSGSSFRKVFAQCFVIAVPFIFVGFIVWLILWFKRQNLLSKYKVMETAILHGVKLPDSFINKKVRIRSLRNGLIWMSIGLMFIFLAIAEEEVNLAALASLPLLIGITKVICYMIEKRDENREKEYERYNNCRDNFDGGDGSDNPCDSFNNFNDPDQPRF